MILIAMSASATLQLCAAGEGSIQGLSAFWGTMAGQADVQRVVPPERWDIDMVYTPDILPGKMSLNVR